MPDAQSCASSRCLLLIPVPFILAGIFFLNCRYAPLSIRLVEGALRGAGWGVPDDVLKLLPGPAFEVVQAADDSGLPVERPAPPRSPATGTTYELSRSPAVPILDVCIILSLQGCCHEWILVKIMNGLRFPRPSAP